MAFSGTDKWAFLSACVRKRLAPQVTGLTLVHCSRFAVRLGNMAFVHLSLWHSANKGLFYLLHMFLLNISVAWFCVRSSKENHWPCFTVSFLCSRDVKLQYSYIWTNTIKYSSNAFNEVNVNWNTINTNIFYIYFLYFILCSILSLCTKINKK